MPNLTLEGYLQKLSKYSAVSKRARVAAVIESKLKRKWKRRFFALKGRQLLYFSTQPTSPLHYDSPKATINLDEYHSVTQDLDSFPGRFCFRIVSLGNQRTIVLAAASMDELKAWTDAIKLQLADSEESEQRALEWLEQKKEQLTTIQPSTSNSITHKLFKRGSKGSQLVSPTPSVTNSVFSLESSSGDESVDEASRSPSKSPSKELAEETPALVQRKKTEITQQQKRKSGDNRELLAQTQKDTTKTRRGGRKRMSIALLVLTIIVIIVAYYELNRK